MAKVGVSGDSRWYIEDVVAGRWSPARRDRIIRATASRDGRGVHQLFEQEGGSAGKSVAQQMVAMVAPVPASAVRPTGSKPVRAQGFASQVEAGNVAMLRGPWNAGYLDEVSLLPTPRVHDDRVDASSSAFNWLAAQTPKRVRVRRVGPY